MDWLSYEMGIRIGFFLGGLLLFGGLGLIFSFRTQVEQSPTRWLNNISLTLLNSVLVRILFPFSLLYLAPILKERGIGLLNLVGAPVWINILLSFLILDCVIYYQHRVFHHLPWLWRLHRVHHTDTGFDTTTALRFHPVEIALSLIIKLVVIVLLGSSAMAILIFEVMLNFSAMFNHANFSLPLWLESFLRAAIVTPDMHRIHHSVVVKETNSNYGFFLSWWDKIFKTYRPQSSVNLQSEKIGIELFRDQKDQRLDRLLLQPLRKN